VNFNEAINAEKVTQAQALQIFDKLASVDIEFILGTWNGSEFPSGHPNDGLLASSGWFGKRFIDRDTVDPLLYYTSDKEGFFAADPVFKAAASARGVTDISTIRSEVETFKPSARLRNIEFRGITTTAMIYDNRPIIDYFRKVDQNTVLGAMDCRGDDCTYFFILRRV